LAGGSGQVSFPVVGGGSVGVGGAGWLGMEGGAGGYWSTPCASR
jgi:hypothetical protein